MHTRTQGTTDWIVAAALSVAVAGCGDATPGADDPGVSGCDDPAAASASCREPPAESISVTATPLFADPQGSAAQNPIVLAHGFNASPTSGFGFNHVDELLRADGHWVVAASVEPFNGVAVRAASLARAIDAARRDFCAERFPDEPADDCVARTRVNVIAHSMGGLDARYAVSTLGYGDRIASITTISTPHRGSAAADLVLGLLPDSSDATLSNLVNTFGQLFARSFTTNELANNTDLRAVFEALAEANADAFNRANPDDPRVYYQSWAGVSRPGGGLRTSSAVDGLRQACAGTDGLAGNGTRADFMDLSLVGGASVVGHGAAHLAHDGMVTVNSARWGVFRGCIPADHLDEVGQPALTHQSPSPWTGFDFRGFYRTVAFDLAARGL